MSGTYNHMRFVTVGGRHSGGWSLEGLEFCLPGLSGNGGIAEPTPVSFDPIPCLLVVRFRCETWISNKNCAHSGRKPCQVPLLGQG